jgi:hypothetical protein
MAIHTRLREKFIEHGDKENTNDLHEQEPVVEGQQSEEPECPTNQDEGNAWDNETAPEANW